jgi:hypothetical protein
MLFHRDQFAMNALVYGAPNLLALMAEKEARYRQALAAVEDGSDPLALVRMTGATYAKEPE